MRSGVGVSRSLGQNDLRRHASRMNQRYIHGIGMMKAQASAVTIERQRNSSRCR